MWGPCLKMPACIRKELVGIDVNSNNLLSDSLCSCWSQTAFTAIRQQTDESDQIINTLN